MHKINPYLHFALGCYFRYWDDHDFDISEEDILAILAGEKPNEDQDGDEIFCHWEPFEYDDFATVAEHVMDMYESLKNNFIPREDL